MSELVTCPYCEEDMDYEYISYEDTPDNLTCDNCEKVFRLALEFTTPDFNTSKDCTLNDIQHNYVSEDRGHYINHTCSECEFRDNEWKEETKQAAL